MTASLENSSLKFKFAITDVLNIKKKFSENEQNLVRGPKWVPLSTFMRDFRDKYYLLSSRY